MNWDGEAGARETMRRLVWDKRLPIKIPIKNQNEIQGPGDEWKVWGRSPRHA